MTFLAKVTEVIRSLPDRWRDAERKQGRTHPVPALISDLITAPLGMFFLFTEHHDDGPLPRRPGLFELCQAFGLSETFFPPFFLTWLMACDQFPELKLTEAHTQKCTLSLIPLHTKCLQELWPEREGAR